MLTKGFILPALIRTIPIISKKSLIISSSYIMFALDWF
jgi:hypothetical protein